MKPGGRVAVGVGLGYLLGRTRKMRLALMIAAAGVTGTVGSPRTLVQRGLKQLASSPELGKVTEMARGELVNAAKAAAVSVASNRIDSLNERLQSRAGVPGEALRKAGPAEEEPEEPEAARDEEEARGGDAREAEPEQTEEDRSREPDEGRTSAATAPQPRSSENSAAGESRRGSTRARTSSGRAPVRRTRR